MYEIPVNPISASMCCFIGPRREKPLKRQFYHRQGARQESRAEQCPVSWQGGQVSREFRNAAQRCVPRGVRTLFLVFRVIGAAK